MKTLKKVFGNPPLKVAEIKCNSEEMFFYQYLPVKMICSGSVLIPKQLIFLKELIDISINDFIYKFSHKTYSENYVYVTAKRLYVPKGQNLNRLGWHSDGFGTNDINYIWCDSLPTKYIDTPIEGVPEDDAMALEFFDTIGRKHDFLSKTKTIEPLTLYRLDETVVHTCAINQNDPFIRTFIKISFSKEKYNLKGNSHNYLFNYNWEMKEREKTRNHPTK